MLAFHGPRNQDALQIQWGTNGVDMKRAAIRFYHEKTETVSNVPMHDRVKEVLLPVWKNAVDRRAATSSSTASANRIRTRAWHQSPAATALQFAYDRELLAACYDHPETLMWREAGALAATGALVATALRLSSVILGRTGGTVLTVAGVDPRLIAVGAVHIGSPDGAADQRGRRTRRLKGGGPTFRMPVSLNSSQHASRLSNVV